MILTYDELLVKLILRRHRFKNEVLQIRKRRRVCSGECQFRGRIRKLLH